MVGTRMIQTYIIQNYATTKVKIIQITERSHERMIADLRGCSASYKLGDTIILIFKNFRDS